MDEWKECVAWQKKVSISTTKAESLTALYAVIYAKEQEREIKGAVFEGDALSIIDAVNSLQPCESSYGHFVEDIKSGNLCLFM